MGSLLMGNGMVVPAIITSNGGGGSSDEIINQNPNGISPLKIWQGTETEWNDSGEDKTWYNWKTDTIPSEANVEKINSPTISDDFIASGFSNTNKIKSTYSVISKPDTFTFHEKFRINTLPGRLYHEMLVGTEFSIAGLCNINYTWEGYIAIWLSSNGTSMDIANESKYSYSLQANVDYYLLFLFDGTKYTLKISTDDKTWDTVATIETTEKVFGEGSLLFGSNANGDAVFYGNVDLKETYLIVNDNLVWSGVKGEHYVYTETSTPTVESTVYSAPNVESILTIDEVGENDIVLSDMNVYDRNQAGDMVVTQSIGEVHPDYLCFIDNVGVRIGNTDIATKNA